MFVGTLLFFVTALNDISITLGLRTGTNISQYGLAIFAIVFIFSDIDDLFNELKKSIIAESEAMTKKAISQAIIEQNAQVSHDIRSPLAALDMAVRHLTYIPEDMRYIIRSAVTRINDIANHLVKNSNEFEKKLNSLESDNVEAHLLSDLIEAIISEKRMQFKTQMGIGIDSDLSDAFGVFCKLNAQEFKRVLSNLINNSYESLREKGKIIISVKAVKNHVTIVVQDNGKGIEKDILSTLMKKGITHGKVNGSGLGLYHAKSIIERYNGSIKIDSKVNEGTTVSIELPIIEHPEWFSQGIHIHKNSIICILDDDLSIHQIWKERFERISEDNLNLQLVHTATGDEFSDWVKSNHSENVIYLVDYELINQSKNGLEIIEYFNISKQSRLVTSRYDGEIIKSHCKKLGVKIIPKRLAGLIPIIFRPS